jgi:tetratricopeptide (TPR) repeat protein
MGKVDITKLTSKIKRTKAWENAESEYSFFYADDMLPPQLRLGEPVTNEEVIDTMQSIIDLCPSFYPAYFDMGTRLLLVNIDLAVETLDTAFEICVKINSWDTISKVYDIFFDNLEKTFHEELIVRYALKLIEIFPDKAILYDYAAQGFNALGEHDKSIEYSMKAIVIEPQNTYFLNNLGISYLSNNRFDDAEKYLNLSIEADRNHDNPKNNLTDCKIMKEKGLSLKEYYLMPADYKKIENYENNEEWDDLDEYVKLMNHQKLHVFHETLSQKYQFKVQNFNSLFSALIPFFDFVKSVSNETFVWEDVDYVCRYFKPIMHKFIFKHGDLDDEILGEVFDSTLMYYRFLFDNMVITQNQFAAFKELTSSLKDELFDKMHRYNKIRHNPDVSEKRKEEIREKLFEYDHVCPFIN